MFQSLTDYVSGSPWTYAFILAICALDVILPLVPSETSVILAGVLAASGDLLLPLVIVCAASGAILGDNIAYWIGRRAGPWIERRIFSGERHRRLEWAEEQIEQRGGYLIVIGRFIPGGRTAITVASGLLFWSWRRFVLFDVVAGVIWGGYAALLGYFGGKAFEKQPWKGFIVAFAVALLVSGIVELVRWMRRRRAATV